VKNAKARFQARALAAFQERLEAQRAANAREAQPHQTDPEPTTPAPAARWERFGTEFRRTTVSLTGSNPEIDKLMAERHGHRLPAPGHVRAAEERLRDQLAHTGTTKVPVHQRPDPVDHPRCPIDGVALEVVSYTSSMKPATRACPVCRRTEREFTEKGVSLESPTEALRASMAAGGITKKPTMTPVERRVRSLIRSW
jgi:hypothetical protein